MFFQPGPGRSEGVAASRPRSCPCAAPRSRTGWPPKSRRRDGAPEENASFVCSLLSGTDRFLDALLLRDGAHTRGEFQCHAAAHQRKSRKFVFRSGLAEPIAARTGAELVAVAPDMPQANATCACTAAGLHRWELALRAGRNPRQHLDAAKLEAAFRAASSSSRLKFTAPRRRGGGRVICR